MISAASTVSISLRSVGRSGMRLAEPVERRDGVIAQHHVAIEHALDQHRLRRGRADLLQHLRNLAADFGAHRLVGQVVAQRADDAIAKRGERGDAAGRQRRLGEPIDQRRRSAIASSARRPRQSPPAPPRHPRRPGACAARDRTRRAGSTAAAPLRAAPGGPSSPGSSTIFDSSSFGGLEVLRPAGPRQERDHRGPDREVLEVAELPRCAPADRSDRTRSGTAAPRCARRGPDP